MYCFENFNFDFGKYSCFRKKGVIVWFDVIWSMFGICVDLKIGCDGFVLEV